MQNPIIGTPKPPHLGDWPQRCFLWLARICLLVALFGAAYLAAVALTGGPVAGCGPESGCNRVLSSRWAYWFGLPVSLPALAVYLCLLSSTVAVSSGKFRKRKQAFLHVIFTLSLLVLGAALWFLLVQRLVIHAWCKFCLATHASAGLAACLLLMVILRGRPDGQAAGLITVSRRTVGLNVCGAMVALAILVAGQVAVKKRLYAVTYLSWRPGAVSRQVLLHDGRFRLDPKELPVLGSSGATNFIVNVFDYTCIHCRALHPLLMAAAKKYSDRLGIITLPMPLDATCNPLILVTTSANRGACEYAKLSLAVWRAKPEAFRQFDDWLFAGTAPPPLDSVRTNAETIVGKEALQRALTSSWVTRQLQTDIALYQANGRLVGDSRLPQLVIGNVISHGTIENQEELQGLIERHMQLGPSGTTGTHSSAR